MIRLEDAGRVRHARELVVAGLGFADRCRAEYLAETDDDREWVPSPRQHSHPIPLAVDNALYDTWASFTGDVRRLLASDDGLSLREVAAEVDRDLVHELPDAYIDVGRMFREPTDIVLDLGHGKDSPDSYERVLRGLLGNGYRDHMRASPLVSRLARIKRDVDRGDETASKKLRYLMWLN